MSDSAGVKGPRWSRPRAQIVVQAAETKNVVAMCCGNELLRTMLPYLLEQLEMCQKSLSAYLETKRAEFPRCVLEPNPRHEPVFWPSQP